VAWAGRLSCGQLGSLEVLVRDTSLGRIVPVLPGPLPVRWRAGLPGCHGGPGG